MKSNLFLIINPLIQEQGHKQGGEVIEVKYPPLNHGGNPPSPLESWGHKYQCQVLSERHFPKGDFPSINFPNVQFLKRQLPKGQVRPSEAPQAAMEGRALWLGWARGRGQNRLGGGKHCGQDRLCRLLHKKLHIWEVANWENTLGKLPLGKMPLGKYPTSIPVPRSETSSPFSISMITMKRKNVNKCLLSCDW